MNDEKVKSPIGSVGRSVGRLQEAPQMMGIRKPRPTVANPYKKGNQLGQILVLLARVSMRVIAV